MSRFDLHRKHPSACLHAVGPDASSTRTLLLSLSTIAGTKISNPPWVNFQSAGWVSFQSAPTDLPFAGSLIDYLGYDFGWRIETLPTQAKDDLNVADASFGLYAWAVTSDHLLGTSQLVYRDSPTER